MLNKNYLAKVRKNLLAYAKQRHEVIKQSGDAQQHAKKAIFALQRDDIKVAEENLALSKKILQNLVKKFMKVKGLLEEGSYKAAREEYVEAVLFSQFHVGEKLNEIKDIKVDDDAFISGLCDIPGELYRYAIKSATERNFKKVKECYKLAEEIIGELVGMDLTGYNRQKFDQAKQALHKLEVVVYELSLRDDK